MSVLTAGLFRVTEQQDLALALLGRHLHVHSILLWGFIATGAMSALVLAGQKFGLSRMSLPYLLGSIFTADSHRATLAGFGVHFLNGWLFAVVYALVFEDLALATWWLGAILGLLHGVLLMTVGMALLPAFHPRMASERSGPSSTRWLQPPGFMGLNYGRRTPLVALAAHIIFGTILGAFYQIVSTMHG